MKSEKTGIRFGENKNWKNLSFKLWGIHFFRHLKKDQLLIILLLGILLMVIAVPTKNVTGKKAGESNTGTATDNELHASSQGSTDLNVYTKDLELRLARILSQIDGAGDVNVMITMKSSSEKVLDKDVESDRKVMTESDSEGGSRQTDSSTKKESTVYDGSGTDESPYVSKELSPKVEGVIVLADGGGNAVVRENISEAVQALFAIEPHKIRIMKKQNN